MSLFDLRCRCGCGRLPTFSEPLLQSQPDYQTEEYRNLQEFLLREFTLRKSRYTARRSGWNEFTFRYNLSGELTAHLATSIRSLPPELLSHIFSFLDREDLVSCGLTCRFWKDEALRLAWQLVFIRSEAFAKRLLAGGGLGRYHTRTVIIVGRMGEDDSVQPPWIPEFTHILMMCPGIEDLRLLGLKDVPVDLFRIVPLPAMERIMTFVNFTESANFINDKFCMGADFPRRLPNGAITRCRREKPNSRLSNVLRPPTTSFSYLEMSLSGSIEEGKALVPLILSRLVGSSKPLTLMLNVAEDGRSRTIPVFSGLKSVTDTLVIYGADLWVPDTFKLLSSKYLEVLDIRDVTLRQLREILGAIELKSITDVTIDIEQEDMHSSDSILVLRKLLEIKYLQKVVFTFCSWRRFGLIEGAWELVNELTEKGVNVEFDPREEEIANRDAMLKRD